jgi:hypothetical protein
MVSSYLTKHMKKKVAFMSKDEDPLAISHRMVPLA